MKYVLDTNVMIEAYRRYYAFDLAPKFWQKLVDHFSAGDVGSIDKIRDEILLSRDPLAAWVALNLNQFDSSTDPDTVAVYRGIMSWANHHPHYSPQAKADLASIADGWLVAYAKAKHCIVITMEVSSPQSVRVIKIPDICNQFSVQYLNTYDMLRQIGVRFN